MMHLKRIKKRKNFNSKNFTKTLYFLLKLYYCKKLSLIEGKTGQLKGPKRQLMLEKYKEIKQNNPKLTEGKIAEKLEISQRKLCYLKRCEGMDCENNFLIFIKNLYLFFTRNNF